MNFTDRLTKLVHQIMMLEPKEIEKAVVSLFPDLIGLSERERSMIEFYCFCRIEFKEVLEGFLFGDEDSKSLLKMLLTCWAGCKEAEITKKGFADSDDVIMIPFERSMIKALAEVAEFYNNQEDMLDGFKDFLKKNLTDSFEITETIADFLKNILKETKIESYGKNLKRTEKDGT